MTTPYDKVRAALDQIGAELVNQIPIDPETDTIEQWIAPGGEIMVVRFGPDACSVFAPIERVDSDSLVVNAIVKRFGAAPERKGLRRTEFRR